MVRDPGLQPERTALAWSRTALAMLVNALILLRAGIVGGQAVLAGIGLLLLAAAGLTQSVARARRRTLTGPLPLDAAPASALIGIAAGTALCSCGALLAILWLAGSR